MDPTAVSAHIIVGIEPSHHRHPCRRSGIGGGARGVVYLGWGIYAAPRRGQYLAEGDDADRDFVRGGEPTRRGHANGLPKISGVPHGGLSTWTSRRWHGPHRFLQRRIPC